MVQVITKRTIVVTQAIDLEDYNGDSEEQAMEYEKNMDEADQIQAVVEALQFGAEYTIDTHCYINK